MKFKHAFKFKQAFKFKKKKKKWFDTEMIILTILLMELLS